MFIGSLPESGGCWSAVIEEDYNGPMLVLALDEGLHRQDAAPCFAVRLNLDFLFESQDRSHVLEATTHAVSNHVRITLKRHCNPVWRGVISNYPQRQVSRRSLQLPVIESAGLRWPYRRTQLYQCGYSRPQISYYSLHLVQSPPRCVPLFIVGWSADEFPQGYCKRCVSTITPVYSPCWPGGSPFRCAADANRPTCRM